MSEPEADETEHCPRCEEDVEPVHREWTHGPPGDYCPDCGCPLHDVAITPPTRDESDTEDSDT